MTSDQLETVTGVLVFCVCVPIALGLATAVAVWFKGGKR